MVQLWVNLPAKHKMTDPKYQEIPNNKMGKYFLEDNSGMVNVIAGNYKNVKGAAKTFSPINLYDIRLNEKAEIEINFEENHNTALIVVEGNIEIGNSQTASFDQFVLFKNEGTDI